MQFINPTELNDPSSYGFTNIVTVPSGVKLAYIAGQGSGTTDEERKSVGKGKRVDLGGRRIIKKKKATEKETATAAHRQQAT